VLDIVT